MDNAIREISKLTSDLIKIPSTKSSAGLEEAADAIHDWLKGRGISSKKIHLRKGFPIIIAEVGKGSKEIMLNGHFDVVPEGKKAMWKKDPYSGIIGSGGVYGRGAVDMKSGLAVQMYTFAELADKADYKLSFSAVSDEEIGGYNCAKPFAEKYSPDLVLVAEPTNSKFIMLGEKGVFWTKLTTKGKTAHASTASRGRNAIIAMTRDLERLAAISKRNINIPKDARAMLNTSTEVYGKDMPIISFNAGMISGGLQPNVVPDHCEAIVDMRLPPGISTTEALKLERSILKEAKAERYVTSEPNYTSPSNKYAAAFIASAKRHSSGARTCLMAGGTDGRFFRYKGIPAITYGPGSMKFMHTYDEYVTFKELDVAHRVYKDFLLNLRA